jgi:hypothetical protein
MMAQRIYARIVMTWDFEIIESESFLYDGPVDLCMGKMGGADSEAGGDAGRGEGRNGGGSGSSGGSERGGSGSSGGGFGGYGGLGIGNPGSYGGKNDPGRTSEGGYSKGGGGDNGFGGFAGRERSSAPSFGSADAAYSRSVHASAPDMSDQISGLTGRQVTRTDVGYVDDTGTRMAYSSGEPTSFGAQATAMENNLGQSWGGAKAMSSMAGDARHDARRSRAREIQSRVTKDLQDPFGLNVDPHQAFAAYNDVMHGMYDKAVAVGAMTPQEVADVQSAYSSPMDAVGKALGFGPPKDITTPYEKSVTAIAAGLVDPTTGKLTAKGWANVAAPALGMLAGPLAGLGMSVAGIPGAIAGALAPTVANAYASSGVPTSKASTVVGETAAAFGLNAAPVAAGVAYGSVMDTMAGAQDYAGTQPESVAGMDSNREGASQFESMFSGFFTKKSRNKRSSENEDNVNPAFKAAREGKRSTTSTAQTTAPVVPSAVTAVNFDSIFSGFFTRR